MGLQQRGAGARRRQQPAIAVELGSAVQHRAMDGYAVDCPQQRRQFPGLWLRAECGACVARDHDAGRAVAVQQCRGDALRGRGCRQGDLAGAVDAGWRRCGTDAQHVAVAGAFEEYAAIAVPAAEQAQRAGRGALIRRPRSVALAQVARDDQVCGWNVCRHRYQPKQAITVYRTYNAAVAVKPLCR